MNREEIKTNYVIKSTIDFQKNIFVYKFQRVGVSQIFLLLFLL